MRKYFIALCFMAFLGVMLFGCKNDKSFGEEETILTGTASIMTDETVTPIMEDQVSVFESSYSAKIKLISKSEAEVLNALLNDSISIAILSRRLSTEELKIFSNRKIYPKITGFGTDALVLIRNSNSNDTLIDLSTIVDFLQGKSVSSIKGLVFDNPNSSTVRYLDSVAGISKSRKDGIYSFNNNAEAIKYVAENDGFIGVVGLSWLTQPSKDLAKHADKIKVLSVRGLKGGDYVSPTQNNIAEDKYPLARDLFIINSQAYPGLGMGFASFITGERGQRIILKSGLLPIRIPSRNIIIRNKVEKEKVNN